MCVYLLCAPCMLPVFEARPYSLGLAEQHTQEWISKSLCGVLYIHMGEPMLLPLLLCSMAQPAGKKK